MALGFTSYVVENDEKVARAMERAGQAATDLRVPLTQISKDFYKSRKAIFALTGPGGYPDLNSRYKVQKQRAVGFVYPILKLTGRLEGSVTSDSHPDNITRIDPDSLTMGTGVPYGIYHQSDDPRSKIPLRKFLFVGSESVKFANSELSGFPERALNTLNTFVLRTLGESMQSATGVKPDIKKGKPKL